jgi:3-oxoacyl-[acyl-carrier protein] reductase
MMHLGLDQKVAVVTGAAQGIGAAIATEFARAGCNVALVDHPTNTAVNAAADRVIEQGTKALVVKADVTDFKAAEAAFDQIVRELGGVDILVCCAGITRDGASWKMSEEDFDSVIDVNLKGVFNYNRAAALHFRKRGWGRIVNIASINGMRGKFGQANYAASKGGLIALTKTAARELGAFQIRVNAVAPGLVKTPMTENLSEAIVQKAVDEAALKRVTEATDVAAAVLFLLSDLSRQITGETLRVDAGQYM